MGRRKSWLWMTLLVLAALAACTNQGQECDTCTQDSDCKGGFVCSTFSDGSRRCGTGNPAAPTRCRVP